MWFGCDRITKIFGKHKDTSLRRTFLAHPAQTRLAAAATRKISDTLEDGSVISSRSVAADVQATLTRSRSARILDSIPSPLTAVRVAINRACAPVYINQRVKQDYAPVKMFCAVKYLRRPTLILSVTAGAKR